MEKQYHNLMAPDDLIEAIFSFFPINSPEYTTDKETIHTAFFELKKEYPDIFYNFIFDMNKPFPYCDDIDFAMQTLGAGALIRKENLYLERLLISENLREHFESKTKPRLKIDDEIIKNISEEVQSKIRINS